jgi:hypothetical protein
MDAWSFKLKVTGAGARVDIEQVKCNPLAEPNAGVADINFNICMPAQFTAEVVYNPVAIQVEEIRSTGAAQRN